MSSVVIVYDKSREGAGWIRDMNSVWEQKGYEVTLLKISDSGADGSYSRRIEELDPDYLCSLDMAGFQFHTVLNTFYYNICTAKQIHFVTRRRILENYAEGEFALNLYFFVEGDTEKLHEKYPYIPNLCGWEKPDDVTREELLQMIDDVIRDVEGQRQQ